MRSSYLGNLKQPGYYTSCIKKPKDQCVWNFGFWKSDWEILKQSPLTFNHESLLGGGWNKQKCEEEIEKSVAENGFVTGTHLELYWVNEQRE